MICERLKKFLDERGVAYIVIRHPELFTAQEIAAAMHVHGKELVKVIIVKSGDRYYMCALPASYRVDMEKLKNVLDVKDLRLATEEEFSNLFPDCEVGAMPPFGNLYKMETHVDRVITENKEIVFQAGDHLEAIKMKYSDYVELVRPVVADFAVKIH
ncbi:MAG: YbaK/EbsC family protein [Nitrospirota bacterium]